jgi:hypothetical protein
MDAEIGPATSGEVAFFYAKTAEFTVMRIDGVAIAMAGVRRHGGRTWVMLDFAEGAEAHLIRIIRALKSHLRQHNETVYTICGAPDFPKAGRLLSMVGFAPTEEMVVDKRIWRWCKRPPRFQELNEAREMA